MIWQENDPLSKYVVETLMGAIVLAIAGMFLFYVYTVSQFSTRNEYDVIAHFTTVGGLKPGSDVRISGLKIGTVSRQSLDSKTYLAKVTLSINNSIKLPVDTSAAISIDGLFGNNYVNLVPGGDKKILKPGERIEITQEAIDFVQMMSRFMFQSGGIGSGSRLSEVNPRKRSNQAS
ncbi:acetyl-CoA carboxylase subunit A [Candidatus Endolissoclinum faulkneri L5]|uniref:Acetyl-CoA carboxylase subunit A n=1 Tax=Candidatus Endolissoclinum faulkneri L5 TaxID=1401328 RepID=V9TSH5_9PROT|nr:outer membrane lipid asymmetry maintenance protein MlaD [Candidatus Endolissoclinum faulkneri]AHC73854.1 acetyl-CoA carboxylase subunit A [Candidatus Endolissoclinum faulkneri L5]